MSISGADAELIQLEHELTLGIQVLASAPKQPQGCSTAAFRYRSPKPNQFGITLLTVIATSNSSIQLSRPGIIRAVTCY